MNNEWLNALLGGAMIGVSVSLMLLWNGRVTGISGILYGALHRTSGDFCWRLFFIFGLVLGGLVLQWLHPAVFGTIYFHFDWRLAIAGILVGFGTVLGSGCTSGHGVCGISRLSGRSFFATGLFVTMGILTVWICRSLGFFV